MKVSQLFSFFGQLLAHDMARTPPTTTGGRTMLCCPIKGMLHPQCIPMVYAADDPYYSQFNFSCQTMLRHVPCPSCSFGKRMLTNQATSFIDCSFMYGVTEEAARKLRVFDGTGMLLTQPGNLMPKRVKVDRDINCMVDFRKYCFESADSRGNQHTILASLHNLFVREHNRIAAQMKILNPHWDGETIFQEARKLVGGIMQSIVYKEFLPLLIGPTRMLQYDLWANTSHYDPTVSPEQISEFNTAAFRLHSTLNTALYENETNSLVRLRDTYMIHKPIHEGGFGKFLKGASKFPAHKYGRHHVDDATKYMYKSPEKLFGPDIQSVNIYRGRDHGMQPYIKLLAYCTNNEINVKTFEDLNKVMDPEDINLLKHHSRMWPISI
ncbi:Chorion peroxidase, partial [Stegodyphus mimosarum]